MPLGRTPRVECASLQQGVVDAVGVSVIGGTGGGQYVIFSALLGTPGTRKYTRSCQRFGS